MTSVNKKFQSPLARARGLGSSREGAHHWLRERVAAVAVLPLVLWVVFSMVNLRGKSYWEFTQWLSQPWNTALLILFVGGVYYHAATGLQVVIEDYSTSNARQLCLIFASKLAFIFMGVASIVSILKIAL